MNNIPNKFQQLIFKNQIILSKPIISVNNQCLKLIIQVKFLKYRINLNLKNNPSQNICNIVNSIEFMSLHSYDSESCLQLNNFKTQMQSIKSPFLQNIKKTTQTFHTKIKIFQQRLTTQQKSQDQSQKSNDNQQNMQKYRQNQLVTQQKQNQEPLNLIRQSQTDKNQRGFKSSELALQFMKEWQGNQKYSFSNIEDVKQNFVNVFNKKLSVKKKQNKKKAYDFKEDQKIMLKNIFCQLQNPYGPMKGFVTIQKIVQFFQENQLFYLFYNLHPNRIKHVLKDFARTRNDSLTEVEFLHVLLMDRPLLKDLTDPYQKIVHRKCILDSESWQQLKKLFNTLDTFGNQTIHIRPFLQKLKIFHSNPNLIFSPVIQFPEIQRIYTLKKIVFDLEHKFQFNEKAEWKDIEDMILNFNHKQEPTLDMIFEKHLEKATILLDSNYFLIQKKVINLLKNTFQKCPKFSQFFVNTKFICNEIMESHQLKQFFKNPIRQKYNSNGGYLTFQQTTRYLASQAPNYIDLDQFLEYFSIKGPITNVLLKSQDRQCYSESQSQQFQHNRKLLTKIRSLEKLQKSRKTKKTKRPVRQVTDFCQFNLTKKQKQTIREKKVKQMIKEKQQQQLKQMKQVFKANPIPADLNPERLKEQQKKMQMQKKKKLQQVAKQRQQDKQIINYLKANTRLFQPLNKANPHQDDGKTVNPAKSNKNKFFTHKPVPWFVQQHLLDQIQREKSQRKKKIYEEAKLKYVRSWNKLPDFFFHDQQKENSAQNSIMQELKKKVYDRPQIVIKANPVPDFKSLHQEFEASLENKRKLCKPTKIQQFHLTSPKNDKKQMHSYYFSPQRKISPNKKWRQTLHSPPSNKITTTKKTQDWMNLNRQVQNGKQLLKQVQKKKQKERIKKQKNFARFMSEKLKMRQQNLPNLTVKTTQKIQKHKQAVHYLQKQTQRELSEMYARVLQRPFLFQGENIYTQKGVNTENNKKTKKLVKKVIKNIEPIDVSQSSNNFYKNYDGNHNKANQNEYSEEQSPKQGESSKQGINQSF